ncbi:MAG TPA: GNAT family N-acetyltransferase [Candidatus Hydrogenedentes bacterium]|nr:GNAT family N-acetyltransferase [Candidatus Hydrogenedentota bacterium]HPG69423.1 GNAT family N-acetyltransferase [Candidatus Hydrogenedentota bacterium]
MTEVTIRPYRPDDRDEWLRMHAIIMTISHAWNYAIQERPSYAGYESTQLVAKVGGRLVGLTDVQYENEPGELCLLDDSRGGYVLEFGRLPEFAGLRIGQKLIDATAADATAKGFHRLEYWSQDRTAQRFYRRIGLKEIGRHYRFRMRAPESVAEALGKERLGIEYVYGCCQPEQWAIIKQQYDIIERPPLEPHLCVGFEFRF